jgi:hypothetical protein
MAEGHRMTAAQLAEKLLQDEHADLLRESVAWMAAQFMEAGVAGRTGAELGERSLERTTHRNGYRQRAGIPGSAASSWRFPSCVKTAIFPSFLEPCRRAEQAVAERLRPHVPKVPRLLEDAEADPLAWQGCCAGARRRVAGRPPLPVGVLHAPGARRIRPVKPRSPGGEPTHCFLTLHQRRSGATRRNAT